MNKIITTTTNTLEGWTIDAYFEPITANVVIGSNIFSDFAASWTDFFGGRSNTYERKLQDIYKQAIQALCGRAKSLGASAIVGLRIDIDEISGKGTQMFMITALGTPVRASKAGYQVDIKAERAIDGNLVKDKIKAKDIINRFINEPKLSSFSDAQLNFLLEKRFPEFAPLVFALIKNNIHLTDIITKEQLQKLYPYFERIDPVFAAQILFEELSQSQDTAANYRTILKKIIIAYDLIDYDYVIKLIENHDNELAKLSLDLVKANKLNYSEADRSTLKQIQGLAQSRFKPVIEYVTKKKMFSSAEVEVWKCPCGNLNEVKAPVCSSCSADHYGFKKDEVTPTEISELIDRRVEVFEELF